MTRSELLLRASWLLTGLTVLSQILWVLVSGHVRDLFTVGGVVAFFLASLTHALATQTPAWVLRFFGLTLFFGWAIEAVGTATGFPFGAYYYDDRLGPHVGAVPWLIPLAWAMMSYPAYLAATCAFRSRPLRVVVAAAILAAWDLFLDPQMVSEGHWSFTHPQPDLPGVPGIPLSNFAGWAVAALVLMTLIDLVARSPLPAPPASPPFVLLTWVYLSNILANAVFFGRPAVAVIGAVGMGIPLAVTAREIRAHPPTEVAR